jgi:hypothetical protein
MRRPPSHQRQKAGDTARRRLPGAGAGPGLYQLLPLVDLALAPQIHREQDDTGLAPRAISAIDFRVGGNPVARGFLERIPQAPRKQRKIRCSGRDGKEAIFN